MITVAELVPKSTAMLTVLSLTIPFFAIILIGAIGRKTGMFTAEAGRIMAKFAFFIALPPMLFLKVSAAPVSELLNLGFVIRHELATILVFCLAAIVGGHLLKLTRTERAIFGLNSAYSNYGYIGLPLSFMAFGDAAALPSALILFANSITLVLLTALFAALKTNDEAGQDFASALKSTLLSLCRNPLLLSVVAGFLFALSGLSLPVIPDRIFQMLAGAAAPSALFALGISLAGERLSDSRNEVAFLSLFKLILFPATVAGLFLLWPDQGLDKVWVQVAILSSCLPIAANVFAMAEFYNAYSGRTATAIMLSTICASITVPVVLYLIFEML